MRSRLLLCSIIFMAICLWALPSWSHEEATTPRQPYLSMERMTLAAGLGQKWSAPVAKDILSVSPKAIGWGEMRYIVTGPFAVTLDADRELAGGAAYRARLRVGYTFGGK